MSNYLSKNGYVIRKESITKEELSLLKNELIARPLSDSKYGNLQDQNFPVYIETKTKIYIPKMYGISKYGYPDTVLENFEGQETRVIEFKGTLYPNQIEPVKILVENCHEKGGGILQLSTGAGKTVGALKAISELKGKSLIIVNKISLLNQWKKEIEKFLPDASIGIIQGQKNVDVHDKDIVLAMLQSLSRIDYPQELFKDFRVVLVDECHNTSSKCFSKVLFKLCAKYTIGLSATPKRSDGCEYVFKWHIGDIVFESSEKRKGLPPIIRLLKIDSKEYKEVSREDHSGQKQLVFASMISELINMEKRNLLIVEIIKNLIKENRKILVLSHRREHILTLKSLLDSDKLVSFTYGVFLGAMKIKDLDKARTCQTILATNAAFSEGVSEESLDTLILCTPNKFIGHLKNSVKKDTGKLNQSVGRIFRRSHIERNPVIVDLQDNFSVYKSQSNGRNVFYKQHFENKIIEHLHINLDDHENVSISFIKTKKKTEELNKNEEIERNILSHCCIIDE